MEWLIPAGAWGFVGIAFVLALYLLRRKAQEKQVPSLLLWRETEAIQEAMRPFQWLRKQWLLLLQLLLVTLLALALMRPALPGGVHGDLVLIFDVSASMQAESGGVSRIQQAREDALALVEGMQEGDTVTILAAGTTVGQVLTQASDKQRIQGAIKGLEAETGASDMEAALSLAQAMERDLPAVTIMVYTDNPAFAGKGVEVRGMGSPTDNLAVLSLRCTPQAEDTIAFARIANYGAKREASLECYGDGVLCDIRTVSLEAGAQESVQFTLPGSPSQVWVTLAGADGLQVDNHRYWVNQPPQERKALLVTEGNVFLEKALALREDVQLYKAAPGEAIRMEEYDLYVLDGYQPDGLPQSGALLVFSPKGEVLGIHPEAAATAGGSLRAAQGQQAEQLTKNMMLSDVALREYTPLAGGERILLYGTHALLAVGQQNGQRAVVAGFDLHDSILPMQADFPILMRNVLDYLLPDVVSQLDATTCGRPVTIALDGRTVSARVETPSGQSIPLMEEDFTETREIGIYTLLEEREGGEVRHTSFALHPPLEESDVRLVAATAGEGGQPARSQSGGREITVFVLLAAFAVLLVEWGVSRRGA